MAAITAERFGALKPGYFEIGADKKEYILTPSRTRFVREAILNITVVPMLIGIEKIMDKMDNFRGWQMQKREEREALLKQMAIDAIGTSNLLVAESYSR